MLMSDAVKLAVLTVTFGCGAALLSYRFYAVYRRWSFGKFTGKAHLPGILGTALMLFAITFACSLGWMHLAVVVLGGFAVSYLYVYVFPDVDWVCAVRTGFRRARDLSGTHETLGLDGRPSTGPCCNRHVARRADLW